MDRTQLLERIRTHGREMVDEFLPSGANRELEELIGERRHEINADAYRVFVSLRALLRNHGVAGCESDSEAGQIMALLNSCPA